MTEVRDIDETRERRIALWLTLALLVTLTLIKPLGGIAYVGTVAFTIAALMQLFLPIRRAEKLGFDIDFVGLHTRTLKKDLRLVLILCLITFPPYIVLHHLYMTAFHDWALQLDLPALARYLPRGRLAPSVPDGLWGWAVGIFWFLEICATHIFGVALPEETFYRGYLQPRLQSKWPARRTIFGVRIGLAAVVASALFAAGHFLGEWNPLRLGPFFPGLVFAWLRNASGSVVGAIGYHALCNILGEVLFAAYRLG